MGGLNQERVSQKNLIKDVLSVFTVATEYS